MSNPRVPYQIASQRPILSLPNGKPLVVHIVVNVEHWRFDHPMPRRILPAPHGIEKVPDVPNYSWAEYGMRCGLPRILKVLGKYDLPASTSINAGVIDVYPSCAEAIRDAGWEFIGHGIHQHAVQEEDDEEKLIALAAEKIEHFTGSRPRGWLAPGLQETYNTPDLLRKAGFDYVCDWILDDLPCWITTKHGPLIAIPYSLEMNDSTIYAVEKHSSHEMYRRVQKTLEIFDEELKRQPRVLTLALHPHLIGVPHRIGYLSQMLELLQRRSDTVFMTGSQIADWFIAADQSSTVRR